MIRLMERRSRGRSGREKEEGVWEYKEREGYNNIIYTYIVDS